MFRHFDPLAFKAVCVADQPLLKNVQNRASPLQKANTGEFEANLPSPVASRQSPAARGWANACAGASRIALQLGSAERMSG